MAYSRIKKEKYNKVGKHFSYPLNIRIWTFISENIREINNFCEVVSCQNCNNGRQKIQNMILQINLRSYLLAPKFLN